MDDKKLTVKQEKFVAAYLKSFNAAQAAQEAGYAKARQSGHENLSHPDIKAVINEHLEAIRADGIGNRAVRIAELNNLNDDLKFIQQTRAQDASARLTRGDDLPEGAVTGLMVEQIKQVGTGSNAIVTKEWAIDKTLVGERQKLMEQAAREVGDRDKRLIELTGANGGPVQVVSAKSKLLELINEPDA